MPRRSLIALAATFLVAVCSSSASAQSLLAQAGSLGQGPGAYLSWWKLLIVIVLFLGWVKMADWINKDGMKIGELTRLKPEIWNPINVGAMLVGFWCAISVPVFWAGLPIYVIAIFTPFLCYFFLRRGKIKEAPSIAIKVAAAPNEPAFEALAQDEGAAVVFKAAGAGQEAQKNLIRARNNAEAYQVAKARVMDGFMQRADVLLIDYTRDLVKLQMMIDGMWHPLEPMDRQLGDAVLASLKCLAGTNPLDRRSRQTGHFQAVVDEEKLNLELISQGVPTGERVQLKFAMNRKASFSLPQLGMWPETTNVLTSLLNKPGLVIISAPPHQGLSTTWRASLLAADRITRDWVGVVDVNDKESLVENILPNRYNAAIGESPATHLNKLLLSQPDALAVPNVVNGKSLDMLCDQAVNQARTVVTQVSAKSAAEAVLRLYTMAEDKQQFVKALTGATCQRLARRLCDTCKQPITVQPNLIQRLGGDPRSQNTLFNPYVLPPPEKQIDEQGKPIEMLPCETCAGIGYIGRIAIFEILAMNDSLRKTVLNQPSLEAIRQVAQKTGHASVAANAYKLALLGITSVNEAQRALKS
ncbi:MAG: Flp pilus assembly complex ATPase component TadA [Mariniblastus sp.]|nr:Flp pilus assembly complex ATPase component TadA [Mariniblastus sp.]